VHVAAAYWHTAVHTTAALQREATAAGRRVRPSGNNLCDITAPTSQIKPELARANRMNRQSSQLQHDSLVQLQRQHGN